MIYIKKNITYFKKILYLLSPREKKQGLLLFILIFFMALSDVIGVASIIPFITILTNPEIINNNFFLTYMFEISGKFGVETVKQFSFFLGIIVFFVLISSLIIRGITQYASIRFSLMREFTIGKKLIEGYLHQPYSWFLDKNSSDLIKNILSEAREVVEKTLFPFINLIAQTLVIVALLGLLVFIDPMLALNVTLILSMAFLCIFIFLKDFLKKIGIERLEKNNERFLYASEVFGAIKDVKVRNLENEYIEKFSVPAKIYAKNQTISTVISQLARYFIEAVAFGGMLILILVKMLREDGQFLESLPLIAVYAFAGYRLMPALQQVYFSSTQLRFSQAALDKVYNDLSGLKQFVDGNDKKVMINFNKEITITNVNYNYPNSKIKVLKNINLTIKKNSVVGIVGITGSGKTTLIDILLGLITPQEGSLKVDKNLIDFNNTSSWQKIIGYVPQQIYLSDASISSNIAFGIKKKNINQDKIEEVSKITNLHDYITNNLPRGYDTIVGERGVKLSGGQLQRIGIARALYHNPEIIVFDEATSALDNITERVVMDSITKIKRKDVTIIMIAHRLTTLKKCETIYVMKKGEIISKGSHQDLMNTSDEFKKMNVN